MANPTWPGSLPQFVLQEGFSEQFPVTGIETAMEAGPAKTRSRFTANSMQMSVKVKMTFIQRDIFLNFWKNTTQGGTVPFDWVDPMSRQVATFRFRPGTPPQGSVQGDAVIYSIAMEKMP